MRPAFAYYGGKTGMARRICDLMPPHRVYIEPFAGSLAVLLARHQPALHEIVNDRDDRVVTFFRALREQPAELEALCRLTPYSRTEYKRGITEPPTGELLEDARRFWVLINQSFAKSTRGSSGWSVTTGRSQAAPVTVQSRLARFHAVAERLLRVSIENRDAVDLVDLVDRLATDDTLIYADPPYVSSTRRNGRGWGGRDYAHEFTDDDHERLAAALNATPAKVILSGYPSDLYNALYPGWVMRTYATTARSSNLRAQGRSRRVEALWFNYEPDLTLMAHAEGKAVA